MNSYYIVSGTYQQFQYEFMSDSFDIEIGGGIRIEMPVAYLETEPYYWDRPQTEQSQIRGFVEAKTSGIASIEIKTYGSSDRIIECVVRDSPLKYVLNV